MAAAATTSERALPRRLFREMLRDVRGGQASGARPGVQKGHRLLTTWLRGNDWRRVSKQLPDGQRVRVWRAPEGQFTYPQTSNLGCTQAEKTTETPAAETSRGSAGGDNCDCLTTNVAGAAPYVHPTHIAGVPEIQSRIITDQLLNSKNLTYTQEHVSKSDWEVKICREPAEKYFQGITGEKLFGCTCPRGARACHA